MKPRDPVVDTNSLAGQIEQLEVRILESASELRSLRNKARLIERARAEIDEIRDGWEELDTRWWVFVVAALVGLFLGSYLFYMNLGWYADQRALPASSDWLLDRLPTMNLIPLLTWGWLALHAGALGTAILYAPRRMPFLLFLLSVYLFVRTLFVFLSPIGAPETMLSMRELDSLFAWVAGEYTFENEFIFSGHTAIPFLFYLFFEHPIHRAIMLVGSLAMATGVLVTHNHYTVDVLSAYLIGYAIYIFAERFYARWVRPLYLLARVVDPQRGRSRADLLSATSSPR